MPTYQRRPGVYLEESLLLSPADVSGTFTVAGFVGVSEKGPINEPILVESWSDYVSKFGSTKTIKQPALANPNDKTEYLGGNSFDDLTDLSNDPVYGNGHYAGPDFGPGQFVVLNDQSKSYYPANPLDVSDRISDPPPVNLSALQADATNGDGTYVGAAFTAGQYVTLGDGSHAFYSVPPLSTDKANAAPGNAFAAEATVTAEDATNAAKLSGLGYIANPTTAWTQPGQVIYVGTFRFTWTGATPAWAAATAGAPVNNGTWVSGAAPGTPPLDTRVWTAGQAPGTGVTVPTSDEVLSYLPFSVYSYFQNGGRLCWVVRAAPATGSAQGTNSSIQVNGSDTATSPLTSFNLTAISPGKWGDGLSYALTTQDSIEVPAGSGQFQDVFVLQILMRNQDNVDEVLETYPGLSITGDIPSTRRVDVALNDLSIGSGYVRVSSMNSSQPRPRATSAAPIRFSGGIDPSIADAGDLEAAARYFQKVEGPVTINIVGYHRKASSIDTNQTAVDWVSGCVSAVTTFPDRQDIFIINDSAPPREPNQSSANYKNTILSYLIRTAGESQTASYTPWIMIPHPQEVGRILSIPPGGAVMGTMARIDAISGVFRAPAGMIAGLSNAIGVQTKFSDSEQGALNTGSNINVIRSVVGAGICIMGARTRKTFGVDKYINARRTLIYIKETLRRGTQFAVFENNDEQLWSALIMAGDRVLRPLWEAGGLRGASADEAYYLRCDETLNTPSVIASGEVRMEVGVALEYPAEFVIIRVTQYDRGTYTNEVQPVQ